MAKYNCDEAWQAKTLRGGAGLVCRDDLGCFLEAGGEGGLVCQSAIIAEALAIQEAINASWIVGFKEIVIESDSKEIITMLRKETVVGVEVESIVFNIQTLAYRLDRVIYMHTSCSCNRTAHLVASFVSKQRGTHFWVLVCPNWLFNCLAEDVNVFVRL
ncbi:hypothetical protein CerSpe_079290 [Prunus speciosa]